MAEQPSPVSSTAPAEEAVDKKAKRLRAEVRQQFLDELTLATEVATAAEQAAYASALLESGVDAATITELGCVRESRQAIARALRVKRERELGRRCPRRHGPLAHLRLGRLGPAAFLAHAGLAAFRDTP